MSDEDPKSWVYAGALPYELSEGDLVCVFSQYGEIFEISLARDKDTGKSRGFCFIKYEDTRSCELAVDNLNGALIVGRKIKVSYPSNLNFIKTRRPAIVAPNEDSTLPKVEPEKRETKPEIKAIEAYRVREPINGYKDDNDEIRDVKRGYDSDRRRDESNRGREESDRRRDNHRSSERERDENDRKRHKLDRKKDSPDRRKDKSDRKRVESRHARDESDRRGDKHRRRRETSSDRKEDSSRRRDDSHRRRHKSPRSKDRSHRSRERSTRTRDESDRREDRPDHRKRETERRRRSNSHDDERSRKTSKKY